MADTVLTPGGHGRAVGRPPLRALAALAVAILLSGCASVGEELGLARASAVHRGQTLAKARCATCHTISGGAVSPRPQATAFAEIARRYTRNGLEWELQAINDVGHYDMPVTRLTRDEMTSLVAYIHPRHGPS